MTAGLVLQDKYRLVSELGEGGMGRVWRAHDLRLDAPVAVKLLHPGAERSSASLARFEREAKAAASLRSPHVVQVLDYGVDASTMVPFLIMEMLEGQSLKTRLEESRCLPFDEVCRVITHVARALTRAHAANIIHRDLKPANIFLVRNDNVEIAKVLDFGIAKWEESPLVGGSTETDTFMGTPAYMSPEQILSAKNVDYRTDLWSLAIVAVECATGSVPYYSDNLPGLALAITQGRFTPPSQLGRVPQGFDAWFARAAAIVSAHRFESAAMLAQELVALRGARQVGNVGEPSRDEAGSATSVSPSGGTAPARRGSRRHGVRYWLLATSALSLLAAVWMGSRYGREALTELAVAQLRGRAGADGLQPAPVPVAATVPATPPVAPPAPLDEPQAELQRPTPVVALINDPTSPQAVPAPLLAIQDRPRTSTRPALVRRAPAPPAPAPAEASVGQGGSSTEASAEPPAATTPTASPSPQLQPWPDEAPPVSITVSVIDTSEDPRDGPLEPSPETLHGLLAIDPSVSPYNATLSSLYLPAGKRYTAVVRICVDQEGTVKSVRLVRPSLPRLDYQLRTVVPRWRYRPYLVDGRATPFCYAFNYTLAAVTRP